ncbi:MAG: flagellar hook-associated protein FlgK [Desulfobacteraceae bacterium]|nr:flagellar hook-associated protein FlgK [Desulfobacteraceae bacterium]
MSGLSSTLSIARTAIYAQQYGLAITGQNIANVNNPDYSLQNADQMSMTPALYAGLLFGTGVNTAQIEQSVDYFLETRLTDEKSTQAAFEEAEAYMNILEGYFDENSDASISSAMITLWNSFHNLADNPLGSPERVAVYENGANLAARLNTASSDLDNMKTDVSREIEAALEQINSYASQIAVLNGQIVGLEANRSANDLRDQRNALLDDLGTLIEVDVFEQSNGSIIVNTTGGLTLVNSIDSYELSEENDSIMWQGTYGSQIDITDKITGGKIAGWLEMRDAIIPKFTDELNVLAREITWATNYQQSQGAGMEYFTGSITGNYKADQSGLLSSYAFGDKIDYTQDFIMWLQDYTTGDAEYTRTQIDMGLSEAAISNWTGTGTADTSYKLTVMDGATLGEKEVVQTDGTGLAQVFSSTSGTATALNSAIAEQTITVSNGPSGTEVVTIQDSGGDAKRSAASIAEALSAIDGVEAYASEVSAQFDITNINDAEDGDIVQFSLYVDGVVYDQSFTVDSDSGTLAEQFEDALRDAAESINNINEDQDLFTSGLDITSGSGRTLGVQDFEVVDNAGVQIDNFLNFDSGDTVTFTLDSSGFGTSSATTTDISVNLSSVSDTSDEDQMATAFYDALTLALEDESFTVEHDPSTNSIILRTTDGSDLTVSDGDNDTGLDASMDINELSGTTQSAGNNTFLFDGTGTDIETFDADTLSTDTIDFSGQGTSATIEEVSATGVVAGVITGTITVLMEPGMSIRSNVSGAGGLFSANLANSGSSIMTLGGDGGFSNFDVGDTVSFDLDGTTISYPVLGPGTTDLDRATELAAALILDLGALVGTDYEIIQNGTAVSIIKNSLLEDPIEITNFLDNTGNDATLAVSTGTGKGASDPENDLLESGNSYRDFATASMYADSGIIKWEKYDDDGLFTGEDGLIDVEKDGTLSIVESGNTTLSFDVSTGTLVAGNTLIINTDETGSPALLDFTVSGSGNAKNEIYKFTVTTGGTIGELVSDEDDTVTIRWETTTSSGSFELEGADPVVTPDVPIEVEVDGMTLKFSAGTILDDDVFTITTDKSGVPVSTDESSNATGEMLSDWHWTIDSFADQFNRQSAGMTASTTVDYQLKFETSNNYNPVTDVVYSGSNGFSEENVSINVLDWSAINFSADDLKFSRSSTGTWTMVNDPTGSAVFIPEGGDDDGFGIDFSGDGLADLEISFATQISGEGSVQLDFEERNKGDLGFAFSDDSVSSTSGLLAAAGINTFFDGYDATTMQINDLLADTNYVAAGKINSETGEISQGDNTNALAMAALQDQDVTVKQWSYTRGSDASSSLTTTTLDGYYSRMLGSMGIIATGIQSSREFADIMVNNLTQQRNAVSAVSLDEEMIKLMEYQHAYSAASKLLTVVDEMLNTLISMR